MLVDTDVLIWYLRGNAKARQAIEALGPYSISAVVYMEILQGIRNKTELKQFKQYMKETQIECLSISSGITDRSIHFLEEYGLSHGLRMAGALIAATADVYGETLLTGNFIHYRMISSLDIKKFHAS
jgi:hypothetical protein